MTIDWTDVPPSLNQVLRMHWTAKRDLRNDWSWVFKGIRTTEARDLRDAAKAQKRVRMVITLHNARQYDRDNAFGAVKVIVDAAKSAGLLFDDRPAYLDLEVQQVKSTRKAKRTVIELEILEPSGE